MARPARFTQRDLVRALKAAMQAGLQLASVRIEPDGAILLIPGTPQVVPSSPGVNPWDR
jgi:hypothetical protein